MHFAAREAGGYMSQMVDRQRVHATIVEAACGPKTAVRLEINADLHPDGYRVRRDGDLVRITGGSGRGSLFGTYAWLHALGCRWPLPGEEFETVPEVDPLKWTGPALEAQPAVRRRGMVYCIEDGNDTTCLDRVDFLVKNGFNYFFLHPATVLLPESRKKLAEALNQREMGFAGGGHILPGLLPRTLFDEHPEYFRMANGKRTAQLNMCPRSAGAAEVIAKNALDQHLNSYLQEFDHLETLHLWPDDLFDGGWCSCEQCKGLSQSDQALLILNNVAQRLPPGKTMLGHCGYHSAIEPPKKVVGHPRVRLLYAPRERSYRQPLGLCKANRWYADCLHGLVKAVPTEPEVFEYYHDMILFRCLPMPLHQTIGPDVEYYLEAGIDGIASLSFHDYDRLAYGPNTYVLGRALWRGRGHDSDIDDYCRDVYGPAGGAMRRYFDSLFELCATAMDTCDYEGLIDLRQPPPDQPGREAHRARLEPLVRKEHLDRIEAQLEAALQAATGSYRERVEQQRMLWNFARCETQTIYKEIAIVPRVHAALKPDATQEQRRTVIASIEEIISDIDAGTELLLAIPDAWKGSLAGKEGAATKERVGGYKHTLDTWLSQLRSKPDR